MDKRTPSVEWTIAQSEAEWERLQGPPQPDRELVAHRRRPLQRSFGSLVALLLLLGGAGDWWWRTERVGANQPTADVTVTAQPALGAIVPGRDSLVTNGIGDLTATDKRRQVVQAESSLRAALQNNAPAAHIDIALPKIELYGDQAVVDIVTTAKGEGSAHRQTRFYQHTSTGWLRTEPDAALWGPERSLETPYFVYHFRQNDAPAIVAVLAQMDALYRIMRRNFGLPLTPDTEKLVIDVSVTQTPGKAVGWFLVPDRIRVPSPTVYLAPVELTDAALLEQSIALPLLNYLLAQASEHHALGSTWQPMWSGLYLWQMWDLDLPLAAWRADVVKWLYVDLPAVGSGQSFVLPEHYTALCAAHKLWLPSPAQMNIPLLCGRPDWETQSFPLWRLHDPLTRLDQLVVPLRPGEDIEEPGSPHQVPHPGQAMALATLIEYAVATYGRERLPALVAGLGQYENWETLIPAVYGVSVAEFEKGWQAYLATRYGVS